MIGLRREWTLYVEEWNVFDSFSAIHLSRSNHCHTVELWYRQDSWNQLRSHVQYCKSIFFFFFFYSHFYTFLQLFILPVVFSFLFSCQSFHVCVFCWPSVVANGDVLDPAVRLLIHQRALGQFDRILEMITEKMGLRVLGGVRRSQSYKHHTRWFHSEHDPTGPTFFVWKRTFSFSHFAFYAACTVPF